VENHERNTTPGNPQVENQDCNTSDGNVATNIDLININEIKVDVSNEDIKNEDVSTVEEIIDEVTISTTIDKNEGSIFDPIEQFKNRVRQYVIDNKINPHYIKDEIESFYNDVKLFNRELVANKTELVFEHILIWTQMGEMHNTAYQNSIQNRIIRLIDEYLDKYNINRKLVEEAIHTYKTSKTFYTIKQNKNPEDCLKTFIRDYRINQHLNTKSEPNRII